MTNFVRVTVSLPKTLSISMENIRKAKKVKKSELIRKILEDYARQYKLEQIRQAALKMRKEYQSNEDLKTFHSIDSEDFLE